MKDRQPERELTTLQHGCIGAVVGSTEQTLMRPCVFWKAQMQQQRFNIATAINPRYCYRGLGVSVASIAPITCIQFSTTHTCLKVLQKLRGRSQNSQPSEGDKLLAGVVAGVTSSLVQSPFQIVEVNQQNNGGGIWSTARSIVRERGIPGLYRGGTMTAIREGIFCCSYVAVAPAVKRQILERYPTLSDGTASFASSLISGGLGAVLSHPADTLKTNLQGSLFPGTDARSLRMSRASGPREALEELRRRGNVTSQIFRGFAPRFFRIVCCNYIYTNLTEVLDGLAREWTYRSIGVNVNIVFEQATGMVDAAAAALVPERGER